MGMLNDNNAALSTIAILVDRLEARDGFPVRITQSDYDNVWQHTLMEGVDDDGALLLRLDKKELS